MLNLILLKFMNLVKILCIVEFEGKDLEVCQ